MRKLIAVVVCAAGLLGATPDEKKKGPAKPAAPAQESMTGCVDQRGETYVLAGSGMKEEAKLAGKAFSDENFARYVGHTVTVRGSVDRSVSPLVVQVVKIDEVSATCR
ncbi:MAG: hypothetical protein SGI92_03515 [Bryobacteraceae bacterium]|nr:hypothetical protein [Bryobacteraceae bacterium]